MRNYIDSFKKVLIFESLDNLSIIENTPSGYIDSYRQYSLLSNNRVIAYMVGHLFDNEFQLYGIKVENGFRGNNLGETLLIEYLKKYGGVVFSNPKTRRSLHADKMWERISNRNDITLKTEKSPYPFSPGYLIHYRVSLK